MMVMTTLSDYLRELIDSLDIKDYRIKGNEIWTLCPNPNHDDKHIGSFSINLQNGKSYCFSCGYTDYVMQMLRAKNIGFSEAARIWNSVKAEDTSDIRVPEPPVPDWTVKQYRQYGISPFAVERVGNIAILQQYDVASTVDGLPIFFVKDWGGSVRGIWVRDGRYYLIGPENSKRDGWLFGMDQEPTEINVLTEGFFDSIHIKKETGFRGMCGMGTYLSPKQLGNLRKIPNLYIMMDGDEAGKKARYKLWSSLHSSTARFCGGYKGDPDEMDQSKLLEVISKAKTWSEMSKIYAKS